MTRSRRFAFLSVLFVSAWLPSRQSGVVTRTELLRAEDARGRGPKGLQPLIDGLRVPALQQMAIRGIGRQERPDLIGHIIPYLSHTALTATVAEALAQSLAGLPPDSNRTQEQRELVDSVFRLLRDRTQAETDPIIAGSLARSIGRLPYSEARQARTADSLILSLVLKHRTSTDELRVIEGMEHGLYTLARSRRTLGPLSDNTRTFLYNLAQFVAGDDSVSLIPRLAWLALTANGSIDPPLIATVLAQSRDAQTRRLAVAALPNVQDSAFRKEHLARVANDPDQMVRLEWVRVYRQLVAITDCAPLVAALRDTVHHVRLAAIDALGGPCPDRPAQVAALSKVIADGPAGMQARSRNEVSWHARAHALVSLARVDSAGARQILQLDSHHTAWQVRMYVARGAAIARDTALLSRLAFDSVGNVREAAIQGLSGTLGHLADLIYVRALDSRDYHVVLAAARALRGAPVAESVRPAIMDAIMRISREERQTSRDVRMELLARIREFGTASDAERLRRLLTDVDPEISAEAARIISRGTNTRVVANEAGREPALVTPPSGKIRVRVKMADSTGGGTFELQLNADDAPMTAARVIALVRQRYYDGLTFHRVVPNFVLQGGSPGMNEYVGDGPFMRDELGPAHHARGTVGISTRGRDTGDAQWFINLVDNYRLDHDYTVFATIVSGMDVVDRILEGDVIESVRVVP